MVLSTDEEFNPCCRDFTYQNLIALRLNLGRLWLWRKRSPRSWNQKYQRLSYNWKKVLAIISLLSAVQAVHCSGRQQPDGWDFAARNIQGSDVAKLMVCCDEARSRELVQIELTVNLSKKVRINIIILARAVLTFSCLFPFSWRRVKTPFWN